MREKNHPRARAATTHKRPMGEDSVGKEGTSFFSSCSSSSLFLPQSTVEGRNRPPMTDFSLNRLPTIEIDRQFWRYRPVAGGPRTGNLADRYPAAWHKFGSSDLDDAEDEAGSYFISAVCWKSDSPTMLAANSQGTIKVLVLAA
ncbi:hypothetical protein B296_00014744 [Ensete ventricosum]|uniref:Uncharacterized protein n=1 Tax=Ensete ventricosum TaxID=4639 RepID=A0A427B363_ENSVE|nr:hypothetical protein B296_00014744 [Ensete ventricosum]